MDVRMICKEGDNSPLLLQTRPVSAAQEIFDEGYWKQGKERHELFKAVWKAAKFDVLEFKRDERPEEPYSSDPSLQTAEEDSPTRVYTPEKFARIELGKRKRENEGQVGGEWGEEVGQGLGRKRARKEEGEDVGGASGVGSGAADGGVKGRDTGSAAGGGGGVHALMALAELYGGSEEEESEEEDIDAEDGE
ncbi:hypothetical protein HK097_005860 [Rhizophlyctis rosea]|uniref:Uncharacterized protein n=1 Tax=Rhizophlyctis rosea TaxID=64517 RepID=A0AAD5X6P2_9FUNG|nr:hypothetical protein HK097_005860 [Rhizophlyctis rosea]